DVLNYVQARFSATPRPFLLDLIRERTDGLPFFVVELLTAMEGAGALILDGGEVDAVPSARETVPSRVQTAVLHQVARLDRDARPVAAVAALLGEVRLGRLPWLGTLAGLSPARRDEVFDQLVRTGLLVAEGDR